MRTPNRPLAAFFAVTTLAVTMSACGSSDSDSASGTDAAPVAQLTNLVGFKTEVVVDPRFLSGLKSLKLSPGAAGKATLKDGTLAFPITGAARPTTPPVAGPRTW